MTAQPDKHAGMRHGKQHHDAQATSLPMLLDPIGEIVNALVQPQLPGFLEPISLHLATLGEMLHAGTRDYEVMRNLERLRLYEDEIEEELRDPQSAVSQGYALIAGQRARPTARSLIP
jgi:hypothetical protein